MIRRLLALLRASEPSPQAPPAPVQGLADLQASLDTLRHEFARLRGDYDQIALDWATTLNRIGQWASRQAAREQRAAARALEAAADPPPPPAPEGPQDIRALDKSALRQLVRQRRSS